MREQIINGATNGISQVTGFSPLEIVLMTVIAVLFVTLMTIVTKLIKEVISQSKDIHAALNNNTKAVEELPDIIQDKIELALKK